ncbi:MAG TPA: pentapeptide repeat-containing protein [Pseudobdellovibrionaceae bacterium]
MRIISEQELKDILDKHGKWLRNEEGGERANLSSANLSSANLSSADLSSANLRFVDLSFANLSSANLRFVDLSSANLSSANLRSADLSSANLRFADLSSADLRSADLRSAVGFKFTPLQVVNTKYFITIFDDHVVWGCRKMTFEELNKFELKDCTSQWDESEFKLNKKIITEMIRYYRK